MENNERIITIKIEEIQTQDDKLVSVLLNCSHDYIDVSHIMYSILTLTERLMELSRKALKLDNELQSTIFASLEDMHAEITSHIYGLVEELQENKPELDLQNIKTLN